MVTRGELKSKGTIKNLKLKIKFKSPEPNNCEEDGDYITSCAAPIVDHIDLIAGDITGRVAPEGSNYAEAANETAKVIASFTKKS